MRSTLGAFEGARVDLRRRRTMSPDARLSLRSRLSPLPPPSRFAHLPSLRGAPRPPPFCDWPQHHLTSLPSRVQWLMPIDTARSCDQRAAPLGGGLDTSRRCRATRAVARPPSSRTSDCRLSLDAAVATPRAGCCGGELRPPYVLRGARRAARSHAPFASGPPPHALRVRHSARLPASSALGGPVSVTCANASF